MGDSLNIYLGPVVSIKSQRKHLEKEIICPNGHKNQDGNFCSVCGSKMVEQTIERTEPIKTWDVTDGDDLFSETECYPGQWMGYDFNLIKDTNENNEYGINIAPDIIKNKLDTFVNNPKIKVALKELEELGVKYSIDFKMLSYWY